MKENTLLFAFFGHHKGATAWMNGILSQICHELKLRFSVVHHPEMFGDDVRSYVQKNKVDFLSFDNADYEFVKQLDYVKGFHLVRDPRDIAVSAYFYHLHRPKPASPKWEKQKKTLQELSQTEGLLFEMQSREQQFQVMHDWDYSLPNILEIKMEDLTQNPYKHLADIFSFLGLVDETMAGTRKRFSHACYYGLRRIEVRGKIDLPFAPQCLPVERLLGICWENDFSKKAGGRKAGQEDITSHYRKGVPGDWKNHFEAVHYDYFYKHYQHLLLKLGYEQDASWAMPFVQEIEHEKKMVKNN